MSALAVESGPIRIFHVEPYPFPLKRLDPRAITAEQLQSLWPRFQKFFRGVEPAAFLVDLNSGAANLFEIGNRDGVVLINAIVPKMGASITVFFWGDKRRFIETYGPLADVRSSALAWLFRAFGVPKLRIAMPASYKAASRLAARSGMKREAWLRREILVGDKLCDLVIYGILREEV